MSSRSAPLRIAIAGLGTVGAGVLLNIAQHGERLARALGRRVEVVGVSARTRDKDRVAPIAGIPWFDDAVAMARAPGIDCLVELIGGSDGVAKHAVEAAITTGRHVVTANKALLAQHGLELARAAEARGVALLFEAAVAGGIPVIKTIREALVGNEITRITGILNGTCNFILTKMQEEGSAFGEVLAEAQALGYAEADPTFDIGGHDTAHKLAILTSLAFGTRVAFDEIHLEGIAEISAADIEAADALGYRIKLLGVAVKTGSGIESRVHPAMVPKEATIAQVSGVTNAVAIEGDFVGKLLLVGPGAGAKATASAVVGDIGDVARGGWPRPFVVPAGELTPYKRAALGEHQGAYYVRLHAIDRPGTMAAIAGRMGEQGVSLESIVQHHGARRPGKSAPRTPGEVTPVVLITHETTEAQIRRALALIEEDGKVAGRPQMIRIERL